MLERGGCVVGQRTQKSYAAMSRMSRSIGDVAGGSGSRSNIGGGEGLCAPGAGVAACGVDAM
jgi:hypothetical protein